MRKTVNIHAAKTHLSRLVDRVAEGDEIIIARAGRPVARLAPLERTPPVRKPGLLKGRLVVAKDFDAPLPADVLDPFDRAPLVPRRRR